MDSTIFTRWMNRVEAFDSGLLGYRELEELCEDVVHELNARGLLVWTTKPNKEREQDISFEHQKRLAGDLEI